MRMSSPRFLLTVLYLLLMIFVFSDVFTSTPLNGTTAPLIIGLVVLLVFGLTLLLGWDYIIPLIFRNFSLGECKVVETKYLVCSPRTGGQYVGYVMAKIIPQAAIADMDKDRKMSYLDTIQGLLAGMNFEVIVAYVGVHDMYRETILDRLNRERNRLLGFMLKETPASRTKLESIEREIRVLQQQPVILEGFYIAMARQYGNDVDELIINLKGAEKTLLSVLDRLGVQTKIVWGEELKSIVEYMLFGNVFQIMM